MKRSGGDVPVSRANEPEWGRVGGDHGELAAEALAGVRSLRALVDLDVGLDREADEQRRVVRVVSHEVDADGEALDDLHEVPGRVLSGEESGRRACTRVESADAPVERFPG